MYKWYKTKCCYCGARIEVKIKSNIYRLNPDVLRGNACSLCIPIDSCARNGIDESSFDTRFTRFKH